MGVVKDTIVRVSRVKKTHRNDPSIKVRNENLARVIRISGARRRLIGSNYPLRQSSAVAAMGVG